MIWNDIWTALFQAGGIILVLLVMALGIVVGFIFRYTSTKFVEKEKTPKVEPSTFQLTQDYWMKAKEPVPPFEREVNNGNQADLNSIIERAILKALLNSNVELKLSIPEKKVEVFGAQGILNINLSKNQNNQNEKYEPEKEDLTYPEDL